LMRTSSITPSESLPIGPLLPMYQLATRAANDARLRGTRGSDFVVFVFERAPAATFSPRCETATRSE
jgi:hypothetical protein